MQKVGCLKVECSTHSLGGGERVVRDFSTFDGKIGLLEGPIRLILIFIIVFVCCVLHGCHRSTIFRRKKSRLTKQEDESSDFFKYYSLPSII